MVQIFEHRADESVGGTKVRLKEKYKIEPIGYKTAMMMVVSSHYLHRRAPCSYSFGLIERDTERVVGVVTYGKPASHWLCIGLCGKEEEASVIELTRLWIEDGTPKNVESFLIGNTIKKVPHHIIVSFAERDMGHVGTVYQATNWIYTGLSDRHVQWEIEGVDSKHCRHVFDKYGGVKKAKEILGDKMKRTERPRKHRYVFFNCNKRRKRELLKKLRYPIEPYPKLNNLEVKQ